MKDITSFLINKYKDMSGDKKVRIALNLSKMVRKIAKEGKIARQRYGN